MKIENKVFLCSNYATPVLEEALDAFSNEGYKLVSTQMAKNLYGVEVMYLFFTRKVKNKKRKSDSQGT
jgi:hypothetical protein